MYAIYIDSGQVSGAEKRAVKLFHELNQSNISCKLIISKRLLKLFESTKYESYLSSENCIIVETNFAGKLREIKKNRHLRKFTGFNKILKKIYHLSLIKTIELHCQDVIILHVFLDHLGALFIKKRLGKKVIFEISSPDYVSKLKRCKAKDLVLIDCYHAVSESVYRLTSQAFPKLDLHKAPIPFFDLDQHILGESNLFSSKENIIIFAHRLIPRKNGILFAKVVKEFLRSNSGWTVKIFGHGPQASMIRRLLDEEISSGRVSVGFKGNILPDLEKSKIFVSLIEADNYPSQSVMEAMYAGNALLLSDRGFTKEKFINSNGLLCNLDPTDVLAKLTCLTSDEEKLVEYGSSSFNFIREKYSKEKYIDHLVRLYKTVGKA